MGTLSEFERFQALMLDSIYGLLDREQEIELEAYLAKSSDADTLRQQAEVWKSQLGQAAKSEFPSVQFMAPPARAAAKPMPVKVSANGPKRPKIVTPAPAASRRWMGWAVACSTLAVVVGFGYPAARDLINDQKQADQARSSQADFDEADKELKKHVTAYNVRRAESARIENSATEEFAEIEKNFDVALAEARKAVESKGFIVRLTGPERAQPGAPNEWRVELYQRNGIQALPHKVDWTVRDQAGKEVYSDSQQASGKGRFGEPPTIKLPVSFWDKVKPESELTLEVVAHDNALKSSVNAKVKLARPVFTTHLATDKPLYKQGEKVWFRSLTLDRATFTPPEKDMMIEFRMTKPGGQPEPIVMDGMVLRNTARNYLDAGPQQQLQGANKKPLRGIGCGVFDIPANAPGGEYVLSVVDVTPTFDEVRRQPSVKEVVLETRKFNVIEYKPETFDKTLEFDGKSYGPGDVIQIRCTASRTQGGKLNKAAVSAFAIVDGQRVEVVNPGKTDGEGVVRLKMTVPAKVTKGEGSITVTFTDGGESEPIIRPLPLIGRELNVEFFPEGGYLIEGVENRVYFQATTPKGKPADVKGYITDGRKVVAEVATLTDADLPGVNRGQGVVTFKPVAGKTYYLKVQKPLGILEPVIKTTATYATIASSIGLGGMAGTSTLTTGLPTGFELPKAKADGVVLTSLDPVTNADQPIRMQLQTPKASKTLVVGAYARGQLVDHQRIVVEAGKPTIVNLQPRTTVGGVTRVTVFEEQAAEEGKIAKLDAVAERLVYHKPAQSLLLNVVPDKTRYNPGSRVSLDVLAMNENEKPVPAILMVAVVNQSVLTMADEKTGRQMPSHFLLASEVNKPEDLEHADFLLGDKEKAAVALDLLLGTQGWRRFAEQHINRPDPRHREEVERMLVSNGQKAQAPIETFRQEEEKILSEYTPRLETSLARMSEAMNTNLLVQSEFQDVQKTTKELEAKRLAARTRHQDAQAKLIQDEKAGTKARFTPLVRFCIGMLLIASVCVMIGVVRRGNSSMAYIATAAGCFVLCAGALFTTVTTDRAGDARKELTMRNQNLLVPDGYVEQELLDANMERHPDLAAHPFDPGQGGLVPQMEASVLGGGGFGAKGALNPRPVPPGMPPRPGLLKGKFNQNLDDDKQINRRNADPAMRLERAAKAEKGDKDAAEKAKFDRMGLANNALRDVKASEAQKKVLADNRVRIAALERYEMKRQNLPEQLRKLQEAKNGFAMAPTGKPFAGPVAARAMKEREQAFDEVLQRQLMQIEESPGFAVREFSFKKRDENSKVRDDFTETVYWHPVLVLPESGRADLQFQLSDSITRYQVLIAGHTLDGRIGSMATHIEARKPFTVDPKLPIEVTASDRIDVPVRIVNDSDVRRAVTFKVTPTGLSFSDPAIKTKDGTFQDWLELTANQKGRKMVSFHPTLKQGEASLHVIGTSDPMENDDEIRRVFRIVPDGFPATGAVSDLLEKSANATFTLPQIVKGTLKVQVNVYPTTLADLQSGLEGLLREPCGCFEQTSTSNYPNLLILDYLKTSDQAKPEVTQRAKGLLERGYAKLLSFECPQSGAEGRRGFEWFGQMDQQHQALTAYGLLQFKDLAKVYPVDAEMIKRTQQYLLAQRDGKGGFKRNPRALDSFGGAPEHITNAFIVWALVESDPEDKEGMDLTQEIIALKKQAFDHPEAKDDPYFQALLANTLLLRPTKANRDAAIAILDRIVEDHLKKGAVEGARTSITRSGGRDLVVETTSITVLAMLRSGEKTRYIAPVKETTKWISQQRGGHGGFGSTQSTILALKALIAFTKESRKPAEAGEVRLTINGKTFKKAFTEKDLEVITLDIDNPEEIFKSGANEAKVEITTKEAYPFSLSWSCSTSKPVSAEKCAVELATKLDRNQMVEGESVRVDVSLKNKLTTDHGMAVAIVGIPGGCRLPADLKELTKLREDGVISYYEIRGRELVLYWRSLKPSQKIDLSFGLIAEVPGDYTGPASRGYLYYNADHKNWIEPLKVTIAPSNQTGNEDVANR
ncbi:MAG: alpha-2-macroglobulin [Planctomycetes bacterium]|nr:alpha-2-macroglobulin [Planctomycetota bacterium]